MEKIQIDLNELLEFNHKTFRDFGDRNFLRCRCPSCPPDKPPALSIHRSLDFAVCFRCGIVYMNTGLHKSNLSDGLLDLVEDSPISFTGIRQRPSEVIMELYDRVPPEGNEYLRKRNPFVEDWTVYKLGVADNEIFIPYFYLGNFIFYQIRYMSGTEGTIFQVCHHLSTSLEVTGISAKRLLYVRGRSILSPCIVL